MAPTPLTATLRYIPPGTRKVYWLTTIASYTTAITRAEINAGTDLTAEIAEMSGFTVTSDIVDTPDLSNRFTAKIPGRITADDSSHQLLRVVHVGRRADRAPEGHRGFVVILPEGDVPTQKMDFFPAKVASTAVDTAMEDPAKVNVSFHRYPESRRST